MSLEINIKTACKRTSVSAAGGNKLKAKYMPLPPAGRHIRNRLQATTGAQLADAEETTEYTDYTEKTINASPPFIVVSD